MTLAVVRRVSSYEEAVVMASALRSAGIAAEVFDILGQMKWTLQPALGGFRVMAPGSQLVDAGEFLGAAPPFTDDWEPIRRSRARRVHRFAAAVLPILFG